MTAVRGTSEQYLKPIARLVAKGMQIKQACKTVPGLNYQSFMRYLAKRPEKRALFDNIAPKKVGGSDLLKANFDQFIVAIESGLSIDAACKRFDVSCTSLYCMVENDAGLKLRFEQAIVQREAGSNATGRKLRTVPRRGHWTEADFEEALSAIRDTREASVEAALKPPLMPKQTVYKWAAVSARRNELLRNALDSRPIAKHRLAVAKGPKPVYGKEVLRRGLLQNDLFHEANAAVRRGLDPILRDDMISEIVEAVLSGTITFDEIKSRGAEIGTAFMRRNSYFRFDSLDRLSGRGDSDRTLGDTLTTDSVTAWGR